MSYEGTVVLNYRLSKKLGEGGFGTVYLAEHTDLGRKAACKILHREFAGKPDVVERFFREAKAVCAIGHRAIIDIENFGALPTGEPFYLMEYFPGVSLADHAEGAPLQPAQLVTVFDAVASALEAAHAKQIVHRDLKPENIMVSAAADGTITDVKLLDFGIAKLVGDSDSVRSRSGMSMGTPAFMSPEQARDAKSVDTRTDVYSFAATVYAAIAGQPPFRGDSVGVLIKVQTDPPTPLTALVPSAPPQLEHALAHGLAKQPADRPPTITEAWRAIRHALASAGGLVRTPRPDAPASEVPATLPPDASIGAPAPATVALRRGAPAATVLPDRDAQGATGAAHGGASGAAHGGASGAAHGGATGAVHGGATGAADGAPGSAARTTLGGAAGESLPLPRRGPHRIAIAVVAAAVAAIAVAIVLRTVRSSEAPSPPASAPSGQPVAVAVDAAAVEVPPVDAAAIAEAPDAAPPADAAIAGVAIDAGKPDRPRPRPPTPRPGSGSGSAQPPPQPPELVCTTASFAAVYTKPAPTEAEVRAALERLNKCRAKLPADLLRQIQQNLVSKL